MQLFGNEKNPTHYYAPCVIMQKEKRTYLKSTHIYLSSDYNFYLIYHFYITKCISSSELQEILLINENILLNKNNNDS